MLQSTNMRVIWRHYTIWLELIDKANADEYLINSLMDMGMTRDEAVLYCK